MRIVKVTLWGVLLLALANVQAAERLGKVEFKEATVKDAVRVISELSRSDVVATEAAARKSVSLYLKNATVESAIDSLCRVTGLWYRRNDEFNTYYIMTQEEFGKDVIIEKQAQTRVFELKHQNVSDAAYAIQSLFGSRVKLTEPQENNSYTLDGDLGEGGNNSGSNNSSNSRNSSRNGNNNQTANLSGSTSQNRSKVDVKDITRSLLELADFKDGQKVSVDENSLSNKGQRHESTIYVTWNYLHNLLVVRASDKRAMRDIAALVKRLDQPAQQVLLEMKILQATLGDEQRSIFDVSYNNGRIKTGTDSDGNPVYQPKTQIDVATFPTEGGAFLTRLLTSKISATIEFLSTQNRIDLLAQPNLLSANNKEASLTIGEDRLLVTGASTDVVTTNFGTSYISIDMDTRSQNIGTTLSIWPRINGDNTVTLDIEQSNTSLNENSQTISVSNGTGGVNSVLIDSVTESTIDLTAIARHGETIALGGMIQVDKQDVQEKVPLLGDLPLIGVLFRKDYTVDTRKELVILITPHISHDPNQAAKLHDGLIKGWAKLIEDDRYVDPSDQVSRTETRHWSKDIQRRAVALIQRAARGQCRDDKSAPRFTRWAVNTNLYVNPEFHCQDADLYVTAAVLKNRQGRETRVQPSLFDQGWVASSGEQQLLGSGDQGRIYLVSVGQPDALLRHHQQTFHLTEEALLNE